MAIRDQTSKVLAIARGKGKDLYCVDNESFSDVAKRGGVGLTGVGGEVGSIIVTSTLDLTLLTNFPTIRTRTTANDICAYAVGQYCTRPMAKTIRSSNKTNSCTAKRKVMRKYICPANVLRITSSKGCCLAVHLDLVSCADKRSFRMRDINSSN